MPEITIDRLMQLIGSAKANKLDAQTEGRQAQMKAMELIAGYDGAISTLQMLIDDLRAQSMAEIAENEYNMAEAGDKPADAMTLEQLQALMPPNVTITGVTVPEE